jgi:CRISPR-associated protein Cmr4
MATTIHAYFVRCITNLHVGSGDANYGVVDKLVQRDPVTGFPSIHASSMKGALREHYEKKWGKGSDEIKSIFGTEDRVNSASGDYSFLGAELIALPVRCNYQQFSLVFCKQLVEMVNAKSTVLVKKELLNPTNFTKNSIYINQNPLPSQDIFIEDDQLTKSSFINPLKCTGIDSFQNKFAFVDDEKFGNYAKKLPVIARNYLENGISQNLWYEEVVPHQSVFVTYIAASENYFNEFDKELNNGVIQIGANASIGYGLCKFSKITLL